jgi:hypothetical protein
MGLANTSLLYPRLRGRAAEFCGLAKEHAEVGQNTISSKLLEAAADLEAPAVEIENKAQPALKKKAPPAMAGQGDRGTVPKGKNRVTNGDPCRLVPYSVAAVCLRRHPKSGHLSTLAAPRHLASRLGCPSLSGRKSECQYGKHSQSRATGVDISSAFFGLWCADRRRRVGG